MRNKGEEITLESDRSISSIDPTSPPTGDDDSELLQDLLVKTSRTFALAIPLLPPPTLREVTVAYLLFRLADTFEDANVLWDEDQQRTALADFAELVRTPTVAEAQRLAASWIATPPTQHEGYLELLDKTPEVIASFMSLSPEAREVVGDHTIRTTEGMRAVVERTGTDGVLRLDSIQDVKDYCYIVAGIVGEMLTELFLLDRPHLEAIADYLRDRAAQFGEGLQLVNILKDSAGDVVEGRDYLPTEIDRADFFALARADLLAATEYTLAIQQAGGPDGVVLFTGLPVELAWATLTKVEKKGPGAKISRPEVFAIHSRIHRAVRKGRPAVTPPGS